MSIPWDSPWRGCASNFPQPVENELGAQFLVETVYYYNCGDHVSSPLPNIVYRSSSEEEDILRHVFRWDLTPYQEVFQNGFQAKREQGTPDETYYNLDDYVHHGGSGRPLDSRRDAKYAFISTTLDSGWHPSLADPNTSLEVWRYEIYAPGGIWIAQTLGDRYQYNAQDEVCFVAGIVPQYIRSAQCFKLITRDKSTSTSAQKVDDKMMASTNFNPQAHPQRNMVIRKPVFVYSDEKGVLQSLVIWAYPTRGQHAGAAAKLLQEEPKGGVLLSSSSDTPTIDWYAGDVGNADSYINAAFRSSRKNEAYLFMHNEYVRVNYAPGTTDDKLLNGPAFICVGFRSLAGTAFAEQGIDSAFAADNGVEAFISSGNLCALLKYAPGSADDKITKGPMTITEMFPFFKRTVFESGVDAAFESTIKSEAYLFKGNQYARINYGSDPHLISNIRLIIDGFPCLKGTIFESGMDAAFASHRESEAYLFKGESYALIHFTPGALDDYLIGGVKKILPNWPSLSNVLPRKNRGLDVHQHSRADPDRDQDGL